MDRVQIAEDLSFSRIVYGMWRIGDVEDTSPQTVRAKLDACLDQGITTFDQADIYGGYEAEAILGAALTPALRDRMEIVTKCDIVGPLCGKAGEILCHLTRSYPCFGRCLLGGAWNGPD